jgi:Domain of unkown function (DUF1775)/Domain of unknown function DUF11
VCSLVAALLTPSAASGHVVPVPQFLATGSVTTMSFAVPNERRESMSGVTVSLPAGLRIVRAHPTAGWKETFDDSTATWRGGSLAHLAIETFLLDVDVSAPPGPVTLNTRELYPSGATVDWPATLTVIPGPDDEQSEGAGWGWIVAIAGVGLIFVAGLAALAWRGKARAAPTP